MDNHNVLFILWLSKSEVNNMTTKMGRPKVENPKNTQLGIRFDQELLEKLDILADYYGKTRAETVRIGVETLYSQLKK